MTSSLSTCQNCLICGKTAEQEELTAFTNISWTKFTQASKVRDDEVAKDTKMFLRISLWEVTTGNVIRAIHINNI